MKEHPLFFIDDSVLLPMFEGRNDKQAKDLLDKMKKNNDENKKLDVMALQSSFLRALWLCNPQSSVQNIQKVLSFIRVVPSFADFKNEEQCREELLKVVTAFAKLGEKK